MKTFFILIVAALLMNVVGCSKKNTNESSGNQTTDTKSVNEKVETVVYKCPGMHCSGCEETIKTEVNKVDGVKDIKADSKEKIVTVSFDANKTTKENISKTINAAGYDTELSNSENKHNCDMDNEKEEKKN